MGVKKFLTVFLASDLLLASGFVNYVVLNGQPLFSWPILLYLLLMAIPAIALAALSSVSRGVAVATALLLSQLTLRLNQVNVDLKAMLLLMIVSLVFTYLVLKQGRRAYALGAIMGATLILTSPMKAKADIQFGEGMEGSADLPPLIHLILDESGPGNIEGFANYPNAYSRHSNTVNAIPDLMDGYEERLRKAGYDVEVWQMEFTPFCTTNCTSYFESSFANLGELSAVDQLHLLFSNYAVETGLYGWNEEDRIIAGSLATWEIMREFTARVDQMERGEAIIFHSLFPHRPYHRRADCSLLSVEEWSTVEDLSPWPDMYAAQRSCAEKLVRRIARDDAIVIVHGDHGNKISKIGAYAKDEPSTEIMRENYSTLFAMRIPGKPPETFEDHVTVGSLLRNWDFETYPEGEAETVFLADENWVPRREVEMPQ